MPIMLRISEEATKIAYKILGKPANMQSDKKKPPKKVEKEKQLLWEETARLK